MTEVCHGFHKPRNKNVLSVRLLNDIVWIAAVIDCWMRWVDMVTAYCKTIHKNSPENTEKNYNNLNFSSQQCGQNLKRDLPKHKFAYCYINLLDDVRFKVLMAVQIMFSFWVLIPCRLVSRYQCFCFFEMLVSTNKSTQCENPQQHCLLGNIHTFT
jgi:hypothetical protein